MTRLRLTATEEDMLGGGHGPGVAMAMRIVTGLARIRSAERLIEITSAHVDSCLYHGRAGLDFAERLVRLDARVRVPTTLNVGSLDLLHPDMVRDDPAFPNVLSGGRALMDAYLALGARPTWTCAPYQIGARPSRGEHVAWAESNAIVFANSVLGARTDRYGDFLDISAAVTGRAPLAGLHLDGERLASLVIDVGDAAALLGDDPMWWGVLGHLVGERSAGRVLALTGIATDPGEDALKGFGAAAASSGSIGMFHVVGHTPEAPDLDTCTLPGASTSRFTAADLRETRHRMCSGHGDRIDAVSLGTPHASLAEIRCLAAELDNQGVVVHPDVDAVLSTSRGILALADAAGLTAPIRAAGFRILVDTCTYITPVLAPSARVVMTNSGKYAHYAPGNIGLDAVLGTLAECVASAATGRIHLDG